MKHIKHINEAKKYNSWELDSKIDKMLDSNIKEIHGKAQMLISMG